MDENKKENHSRDLDTGFETSQNIFPENNLKITINELKISSEEKPYIVLMNQIKDGEDMKKLRINISDEVKTHSNMCYTTDLTTIKFIFEKMTLRSSSLTYAKLNDKMEKNRVGVTQFAGSKFITCFSHRKHENVAMWSLYGGTDKSKKVLLKFKNFSNYLENVMHTDYCLLDGDKKLFFYTDEYKQTINQNGIFGQKLKLPTINLDFDNRNCVRNIEMFDIEYIPVDDDVFKKNYSDKINLEFAEETTGSSQILSDIICFQPECLGKQKSDPWDYEEESRILSCLDMQDFNEWAFIDLRLKEEIFRDLVIIMSPWAEISLEKEICDIIALSPLSREIKETITIKHSDLEGTINL